MLTWLGVFSFCPRFRALKTGQFRDFDPQRAISRLQNPLSFLRTVERACECLEADLRDLRLEVIFVIWILWARIAGPVMVPWHDFGAKSLNYDPCAGLTTRYLTQTHHTSRKILMFRCCDRAIFIEVICVRGAFACHRNDLGRICAASSLVQN